jgi:hypothetical protein
MDTGRLSVELCEAKIEEHSKPDEVTEPCCACEEAKYEVTFEGLWSEENHPKDFPLSRWLLHFSDIIGASHSANYRYLKKHKGDDHVLLFMHLPPNFWRSCGLLMSADGLAICLRP